MKRIFASAALASFGVLALAQVVRVEVNGVQASYDGTPPQIRGGRVLVPVRGTLDQMDVNVDWNPETQVVTAKRGDLTVTMRVNQRVAYKNGQPINVDVPVSIIEGRTLVPLRFMSEAFGAQVSWDAIEKTVTINAPGP